ncbi:periplasmic heavy metal sensor [Xanthobacter flavus]|uniref:periplasmic heavy metal sensor n=1 Tax=Xanthobacter flavus TaxID=281 RepID=UPI00372C985E
MSVGLGPMSGFSGLASAPRRLLVASLALNLFFAGLALAVVMRAPHKPVSFASPNVEDRSPRVRIDRLAATLPMTDARLLLTRFGAANGKLVEAEAASRAAQERAREAFLAMPFDPTAARAALSGLRDARRDVWSIVHDVIIDAAGQMSPDGRARIAAWVPPVQPDEPAR